MHFWEMVGFIWGAAVVFLSFSPFSLKHSDYFQPEATHRKKTKQNKTKMPQHLHFFFLIILLRKAGQALGCKKFKP